MDKLFAIMGCLCVFTAPVKDFSQQALSLVQSEEKPKKEQVFTVYSTKYVLPSTIIDDFFRSAKITTYSYNKDEINKIKLPKFQIFEKNFEDTKFLLEKFMSIKFETDEKKTYYEVKVKK
jgi:hypothetical protein